MVNGTCLTLYKMKKLEKSVRDKDEINISFK